MTLGRHGLEQDAPAKRHGRFPTPRGRADRRNAHRVPEPPIRRRLHQRDHPQSPRTNTHPSGVACTRTHASAVGRHGTRRSARAAPGGPLQTATGLPGAFRADFARALSQDPTCAASHCRAARRHRRDFLRRRATLFPDPASPTSRTSSSCRCPFVFSLVSFFTLSSIQMCHRSRFQTRFRFPSTELLESH